MKHQKPGLQAGEEPDFYPTSVIGLQRFLVVIQPFSSSEPSNQRGCRPGLNTLTTHGYIGRKGIAIIVSIMRPRLGFLLWQPT